MTNRINKMALGYILNGNNNELGIEPQTVSVKKSVQEQITVAKKAVRGSAMATKLRKDVSPALILTKAWQNPMLTKQKKAESHLSKARALFKNADRSDSTNRRLIRLFATGLTESAQQPESLDPVEISQALAEVGELVLQRGDIELARNILNASLEIKLNHGLVGVSAEENVGSLQGALQLLDFARSPSENSLNLEQHLR